jgi:multiple sugar transport system substrate-binding protein
MFRTRPLLLLLLPAAVLLAGCVPKNNGKTRIQYSFWGSIEQQAVERMIAAEFEKANPDVEVELVPIGTRYSEKVQSMIIGDVAPDIIMTDFNQYLEWAKRGALADVTDLTEQLTSKNELMPIPQQAFRQGGRYHAFPINCSGVAMFYNVDALAAAGIRPEELDTWEDLWRLAPRLSRRGGNPEAKTDYAALLPSPQLIFWGYGGELLDDIYKPTKVQVNAEAFRRTVELMRKARAEGWAVPPDVSTDQGTYQLFRDGKVAVYIDGRWRSPELVNKTAFTWDVRAIPGGPAGRVTQHGGTGIAISSQTQGAELDAARRFFLFYASERGLELATQAGRSVPVYRDMAYGASFLNSRPPEHIRVFSETMEPGASRFITYTPGTQGLASIFSGAIERALSDPSRPVDLVQKRLEQDLERWLRRQKDKGML